MWTFLNATPDDKFFRSVQYTSHRSVSSNAWNGRRSKSETFSNTFLTEPSLRRREVIVNNFGQSLSPWEICTTVTLALKSWPRTSSSTLSRKPHPSLHLLLFHSSSLPRPTFSFPSSGRDQGSFLVSFTIFIRLWWQCQQSKYIRVRFFFFVQRRRIPACTINTKICWCWWNLLFLMWTISLISLFRSLNGNSAISATKKIKFGMDLY